MTKDKDEEHPQPQDDMDANGVSEPLDISQDQEDEPHAEAEKTGSAEEVQPTDLTGPIGNVDQADTTSEAETSNAPDHFENEDRTVLSKESVTESEEPLKKDSTTDQGSRDVGEAVSRETITSEPLAKSSKPATKSTSKTSAIQIGTTINYNYEVTHILKAGGMGEVYRGIELGTGDPVAIKSVLPELAEDEKTGLLFKREARTLRQLSDPAIVRYYNYVYDRELEQYFLVMEFIDGVTLSEHINANGAMSVPSCQILLKRLATGLAKAHVHEVIHRDLSPDNVMLPRKAIEDACLIDFGIAQSNVLKDGTMAGSFAGKFKYVSPEQLGHFDGHISPATDIYGLGLLMAGASIGTPLDMGNSIVEAVDARREIPDLSRVPHALKPLLSFMLEPDPAERPASMQEIKRLVENPNMIPPKYGGEINLNGHSPQTTGGAIPLHSPPPEGLQVPRITTGPITHRIPSSVITEPTAKSDHRGTWLLGASVIMFCMMIGVAGVYAWKNGLIGDRAPSQTATNGQNTATNNTPPAALESRDSFLKSYSPKPCTYLSRVTMGPNPGVIDGFSQDGNPFSDLPSAYEQAFGTRPAVIPRQVTQKQCAALEFSRALQANITSSVQMLVTPDHAKSGENLHVDIAVNGSQSVWTALISPVGGVYNLSSLLSENVGGKRSLNVGLSLSDGVNAAPQLILSVASDHPIAHAAAAKNGAKAEELLPLILTELQDQNSAASVALSYVMLSR